jgi:hypothetical protein
MPTIAAKDLRPFLPAYHGKAIDLRNDFKYPGVRHLWLCAN